MNNISLAAKWLPSSNTSSKETRRLAKKLYKGLGISPANYRKMLSKLRAKIKIVEAQMCAKEWNEIDYQRVPSRASMLYRKAFARHDEDGYAAFLAAVEKGEKKINASTLYPYDLVGKFVGYGTKPDATLEAQWKALPNYLEGGSKGIVVADVSGSMSGLPIQVSVSLAIYMAERNVGPFKDAWITFSGTPNLEILKGETLYEKIQNMDTRNWAMNTDVNAVFDLILSRGKMANVLPEDMPDVIYIISDMQMDRCTNTNQTNFEYIREQYALSGYKMPKLVFWNVSSHETQSPVNKDENGTMLVSGCSPSIFKSVMESKTLTPYDLMLEILNSARYDVIKV